MDAQEFPGGIPEADCVLAFCQASFRMTLSWVGFLTLVPGTFPTPGGHPHPGIKPESPVFPALAGIFFVNAPAGKPD